MRHSEMDSARSSTSNSPICNGFRLVFRFEMGVSVFVAYPRWHLLPSWLQPLVHINYSAPSCIDLQRHPLIFSYIRTHPLTMLSPSGEQDQTPNHQSEMKPANKERGIMRASKSAKIFSWPTQMMTTTKPDSWL